MTADWTLRDLEAGRLSQTCPSCGLVEAAGYTCSADGTRTGPDTWTRERRNGTSQAAGDPEGPEAGSGFTQTALPL